MWTIVDLTDLSLVAAATGTDQGSTGRRRIESEATLQDAAIAPLCDTPQQIDRDGWQASYLLTSSDGLELRDVSYQGRPLLTSIKVVDWHVGYRGVDEQRVGFSDVDSETAEMRPFVTLPGTANERNPFGMLGLFYACDTGTLYAGTVIGSTPSAMCRPFQG